MRSSIQTFTVRRAEWNTNLVIDFSETNCCIITGSNGGGKTLTMKMLELVGKWISDPTRFNFDQLCSLADKTQIEELTILIRTPLIVGREHYSHTNHWTDGFRWDTSFWTNESINVRQPMSQDDYDFVVDIARLSERKISFLPNTHISRRTSLSIHYMTRHKSHRSQRDKEMEQFYANMESDTTEIPFTPIDKLSLETHDQPNVFEHGIIHQGSWEDCETSWVGSASVNEPSPDEFIGSKTIMELLTENGIILESRTSTSATSTINLPRPVSLNVERRPQDIASDMDSIRDLDALLYDPEKLYTFLEEGQMLHDLRFNSDSQISPIVMDAKDGEFVDIGPMELDPFEQHYVTMSQPFFPSWFGFKKFVGHIPDGNYLSSGQLQLLSMTKAVLATDYNSLLMIDEPELSLHIDWQRDLIQFFSSLFPQHTFLFSTHSPDILYNQIEHVLAVPPVQGDDEHN